MTASPEWIEKACTACEGMEDPVEEIADLRARARIWDRMLIQQAQARGVGTLLPDHADARRVAV